VSPFSEKLCYSLLSVIIGSHLSDNVTEIIMQKIEIL